MTKHRDPVCGMEVEVTSSTPRAEHQGATYYFCSTDCRVAFEKEPARYAASAFAKAGSVPTPKFGSAGSGGAEFEPAPGNKPKR
jgi:YHS domain-containing protein